MQLLETIESFYFQKCVRMRFNSINVCIIYHVPRAVFLQPYITEDFSDLILVFDSCTINNAIKTMM